MDTDTKFWVIVVISLLATCASIFFACLIYFYALQTNMASKGYEQVMIPGSSYPVYQKVR